MGLNGWMDVCFHLLTAATADHGSDMKTLQAVGKKQEVNPFKAF